MVLYGKTKTLMWIIQIRSWLKYIKVYEFITSFENVLFMFTILWLIFSLM